MSHYDEAWYVKRAREKFHRDGELEVDHGALVSTGADDGAYVQCWVWVADDPIYVEETANADD
jgi:hypothetical protein